MGTPPTVCRASITFLALVTCTASIPGCNSPTLRVPVPRAEPIAKENAAQQVRADLVVLCSALDAYAVNNAGVYPDSLQSLVTPDVNGYRFLNQTRVPKDPWNEEYGYKPPVPGAPQPCVFTLGRDKSIGGSGDDTDIDSISIANED